MAATVAVFTFLLLVKVPCERRGAPWAAVRGQSEPKEGYDSSSLQKSISIVIAGRTRRTNAMTTRAYKIQSSIGNAMFFITC